MKQIILEAQKENQTFKIVERMGYVNEQLKKFKTTVYRLEQNDKLLSVSLAPQLDMYKRILLKEGFNVTLIKNHSLDALISAYKVGIPVIIEDFFINGDKLELFAYIEGSCIDTAKRFEISQSHFVFILDRLGFLNVHSDGGVFCRFDKIEFYDIKEIYDFFNFTQKQQQQVLKNYLIYKLYI